VRILIAHNAYQQRGGEDSVVDAEAELLRSHGHEVELYSRSNEEVPGLGVVTLIRDTMWSARTGRDLKDVVRRFRPDIIHAHNTFPLISPSLYWAARRERVPVVQTLHNFRLLCLNALFLRQGSVCEDCMGRAPWPGVVRGCYRGSRGASAALAGSLILHRGLGTYTKQVARYIALNEFCRAKFIEGGLPASRIVVKPNFVDWAQPPAGSAVAAQQPRDGFLFVGRLSLEKGIETLAQAMTGVPELALRVAGEGPESARLQGMANVEQLASLPGTAVMNEMLRAVALVTPSICYENFPRVIVEAYACSLPVIASRIGALAEIVVDGETGVLFEPGNADDLARKLAWAQAHPAEMARIGRQARARYEEHFSREANYAQLMQIYNAVLAEGQSGRPADRAA